MLFTGVEENMVKNGFLLFFHYLSDRFYGRYC